MTVVRRAARYAAVGSVILALAATAACQQPTPGVTVQSGSRVVRDTATLYVRNGKQVRGSGAVKVLSVRPGALVGIDVDRTVADHGWSVFITTGSSSSSTVKSPILRGHHFSFDVGSGVTDVVVSEQSSNGVPQGLWAFRLQPVDQ